MPASDEFKAKIKTGKIAEALAMAIGEATELQITTYVSTDVETEAVAVNTEPDSTKLGHRLQTKINLIDNKIENEFGEQLLDNGIYSELRQFHQQQVNESPQLMQNNISNLQKLLGIWARLHDRGTEALVLESEPSAATSGSLPSAQPPVASAALDRQETPIEIAEDSSPATPPSDRDGISLGTAATIGTLGVASLGIAALGREEAELSAATPPVSEPEVETAPLEVDGLESIAPPPPVEVEAALEEEEWEATRPPVRYEEVAEEEEWEATRPLVRYEEVAEEEEWEVTLPPTVEPEVAGIEESVATAMPLEVESGIDSAIPSADNWNVESSIETTAPPDVEPVPDTNAGWNEVIAPQTYPEVETGSDSWNQETTTSQEEEIVQEINSGWNLDAIAPPPMPEVEAGGESWNQETTTPQEEEIVQEINSGWNLDAISTPPMPEMESTSDGWNLETQMPQAEEPLPESNEQWNLDAIAPPPLPEVEAGSESWNQETTTSQEEEIVQEINSGWNLDAIASPPMPEMESTSDGWNLEAPMPQAEETLPKSNEQWNVEAIATPPAPEVDSSIDNWNLEELEAPTADNNRFSSDPSAWTIDSSIENSSAEDIDPFSPPLTSNLEDLNLEQQEEWDNWMVGEETPDSLSILGEPNPEAEDGLADLNLDDYLATEMSQNGVSSDLDPFTDPFAELDDSEDLLPSTGSNGESANSDLDLDGEWEALFGESSPPESQNPALTTPENRDESSRMDDLNQWIDDDELFADLMSPDRQPPSPPTTDRNQ
ncbi:MAG: hypothetical protein KME17_03425 [Cyanosarcina radialis HA8281-LM2]|jgi:hypothetical protein|nr:hypothetical protein [Cyanosarcina radialis HA8281-LM2]